MSYVTQLEEKSALLLEELKNFEPGTKEHKGKLDEIKEVGELLVKFKGVESEVRNNDRNHEVKVKQMKIDIRDKQLTHALSIGSLLVGIGTVYCTFRFDEKGTITSTLGRQILQRFVPRK